MGAGASVRDQTSRVSLADREVLALTWAAGHTPPRMVTDAIQPSCRLAVTQRDERVERVGSRSTPISAAGYTRPRMGTDAIQPTTASRSPDRVADHAAADRSAPVLSVAPLIRVAPARHASVLGTADDVGRKVHHATPTYVATLAVSSKQMSHVYDRHHAWRRACLSARRASKEARV